MIAVGVPAFDKKMNNRNGTLKSARLLGKFFLYEYLSEKFNFSFSSL